MSHTFLEELFDSPIKVRLMKLFLRNQEQEFTLDDITEHIQADASSTRYQLRKLRRSGMLNSKLTHLDEDEAQKEIRENSGHVQRGRKRRVYFLNKDFLYLEEMQNIILGTTPISNEELITALNEIGRIKLVVLSGIFVNHPHSRVDLLLVGEGVDRKKFRSFLTKLESEMGKELRYTLMENDEFRYRWGMFDNFIHKIFKEPHETILDLIHVHQ